MNRSGTALLSAQFIAWSAVSHSDDDVTTAMPIFYHFTLMLLYARRCANHSIHGRFNPLSQQIIIYVRAKLVRSEDFENGARKNARVNSKNDVKRIHEFTSSKEHVPWVPDPQSTARTAITDCSCWCSALHTPCLANLSSLRLTEAEPEIPSAA